MALPDCIFQFYTTLERREKLEIKFNHQLNLINYAFIIGHP